MTVIYEVPLNRVGVIAAEMIDPTGETTNLQLDTLQWSIGFGSDKFSLVVSADGLTAEIHPIAEGNGSIVLSGGQIGGAAISQDRSIHIIANTSDTGNTTDPYPVFVAMKLNIVHNIGEVA